MIFIIEYDPPANNLLSLQKFPDAELREARDILHQMELNVFRNKLRHEVVMLEAEDEATIRRSHAHYFGIDAIQALADEIIARRTPVPSGT